MVLSLIHIFIGIGPALYKHKSIFRKYKKLRSIFFKSTDEFLKKFHLISFDNEAISVSYTHLDVYKRQALPIPKSL